MVAMSAFFAKALRLWVRFLALCGFSSTLRRRRNPMTFGLQSMGHCGVSSLQYALTFCGLGWHKGKPRNLTNVRRLMGVSRWRVYGWGVDGHFIARGAERVGLEAKIHTYMRENVDAMMKDLERATRQGHPCIVSWHDDDENHFHWVCVAGFSEEGNKVCVADPIQIDDDLSKRTYRAFDKQLAPGLMSRERFEAWVTPYEELDDDEEAHYFIELKPTAEAKRFFRGAGDDRLFKLFEENPEVMVNFDEILDDLAVVFSPAPVGASAAKFLEQHRELLLSIWQKWTCLGAAEGQRMLSIVTTLADYYDLRVPRNSEATAVLANLSFCLGWQACTSTYDL